ncbi:hypothetical protein [Spirosoma fluminis]
MTTINNKPVKPELHGIIDYVFAGVQLLVPSVMGLNAKATRTYQALGAGFLAVNALTDTPAGIKPALTFKEHQKLDATFLVGQTLMALVPFIRNDKKALAFHLGFLSGAIAHYVLTDYDAGTK